MPSGPKKRKQARRAKRDGSPVVDSPGDLQVVTELDTERGDDSQDDQDDESLTPRTPVRPNEPVERDRAMSQTDEWVRVLDFDVGTTTPVTEEPTTECDAAAEEENNSLSGPSFSTDWDTVLQGTNIEAIGEEAILNNDRLGEDGEGVGFQSRNTVEVAPDEVEEKLEGSVTPIIIEWDMETEEDDRADNVENNPNVAEPDNESESIAYHQDTPEDNPASEADNPSEPSVVDAANYPDTGGFCQAPQPSIESAFIEASDPVIDDQTELAQPPATFELEESPENFEGVEEGNHTEADLSTELVVSAAGSDNEPATEPGLVDTGSGAANSSEEADCQIADSEAGAVDTIDWPTEESCPGGGDEMGTYNVPLEHNIVLDEQQWQENVSSEVLSLEESVPSIAYEYPVVELEKSDDTISQSVEGSIGGNDVEAPTKCSAVTEELSALGFNEVDVENDATEKALVEDNVQQSPPPFEAHTTAVEIEGEPQYIGSLKENTCDSSELVKLHDYVREPEQKDMDKGPLEDAKEDSYLEDEERPSPEDIEVKAKSLPELVEVVVDAKSMADSNLPHKADNITEKEAKEDMQMKPEDVEKKILDTTCHDEVEANSTAPQEESLECSIMPTILSKDAPISYTEEEHQETSAARGVSNALSVGKKESNGSYVEHQDVPTSWKGCCGMFDWLVGQRN